MTQIIFENQTKVHDSYRLVPFSDLRYFQVDSIERASFFSVVRLLNMDLLVVTCSSFGRVDICGPLRWENWLLLDWQETGSRSGDWQPLGI